MLGFKSDSSVKAVSLAGNLVTNTAAVCRYFALGPLLPSQPHSRDLCVKKCPQLLTKTDKKRQNKVCKQEATYR